MLSKCAKPSRSPTSACASKAGNDVWIVYYRVHIGQDTRDNPEYTERGYLYSSAEGLGRLTNKNIDFKTLVEELNVSGVKDYQWRTHAYVLWKRELGAARWKYGGGGDGRDGGNWGGNDGGYGAGNDAGDDDQSNGDADGDVAERFLAPLPTPEEHRAIIMGFIERCEMLGQQIKDSWRAMREEECRPA